jgi:hypothetical protein
LSQLPRRSPSRYLRISNPNLTRFSIQAELNLDRKPAIFAFFPL